MKPVYNFYTFNNKRKCILCSTPIADQVHAKTKFCPREVLADGSIKSCRDDYHATLAKERNQQYKRIGDFHKDAHKRIGKLFDEKGETVATEHLNQYGIKLNRPVQFAYDSNRHGTFYFVEFTITQIASTQYKISRHGYKF